MQNDNEELPELKVIYDELWSDAKTLAIDLNKSISVYVYAGLLTVVISVLIGISFVGNFLAVLTGSSNFSTWYDVFMGGAASIITVVYGALLLKWYLQLKRRYSKLIEMKKKLGE